MIDCMGNIMGNRISSFLLGAVAIFGFANNANAYNAILHMQGEKGSRETYYADFQIVWNRTPIDKAFGPIAIREMPVTIIYEDAKKPEYSVLQMQFECPNMYAMGAKAPKPDFNAPVRFRLASGSYYTKREDLRNPIDIPPSEWKTANSAFILKAHKLACNQEDIIKIMGETLERSKSTKVFDIKYFGERVSEFGLPKDIVLTQFSLVTEFLDQMWTLYWYDTKRPDPTGAWSTKASPEKIEEYKRIMAENKSKLSEITEKAKKDFLPNIQEMQISSEFNAAAAKMRGNRKMSKAEKMLLPVWLAKDEFAVASKMGNPRINESGGLRFLSYFEEYDNRSIVQDMKSGATWEEGLYSSCDMQFVMMRDKNGAYRVADVVINSDSNQIGGGRISCSSLVDVPN